MRAALQEHRFGDLAAVWSRFWQGASADDRAALTQAADAVAVLDSALYTEALGALVPDVLQFIAPGLTKSLRSFGKQADGWMRAALGGYDRALVEAKAAAVAEFGQACGLHGVWRSWRAEAAAVHGPEPPGAGGAGRAAERTEHHADARRLRPRRVPKHCGPARVGPQLRPRAARPVRVRRMSCVVTAAGRRRASACFSTTSAPSTTGPSGCSRCGARRVWRASPAQVVAAFLKRYEGQPDFARRAGQFLVRWAFVRCTH